MFCDICVLIVRGMVRDRKEEVWEVALMDKIFIPFVIRLYINKFVIVAFTLCESLAWQHVMSPLQSPIKPDSTISAQRTQQSQIIIK